MTLNYMMWLTSTKNILIPKLVENTRTSNVDLTLASSSQIAKTTNTRETKGNPYIC